MPIRGHLLSKYIAYQLYPQTWNLEAMEIAIHCGDDGTIEMGFPLVVSTHMCGVLWFSLDCVRGKLNGNTFLVPLTECRFTDICFRTILRVNSIPRQWRPPYTAGDVMMVRLKTGFPPYRIHAQVRGIAAVSIPIRSSSSSSVFL